MTGKKTDIWMPLYVAEYLGDTMHLNAEQHGGYMLLIMACWKNGGRVMNDDASLSAIARMPAPQWKKNRAMLTRFFQVTEDGFLEHGRVMKELARAKSNSEKRSKSGKEGAAKRWQTDSKDDGGPVANDMADLIANVQQNDGPSPSPKDLTPSDPNGSGVPPPETDAIKDLFDTGVALLGKVGVGEKAARALVGRLRMAKGDPQAMAVLIEARSKTDPQAYIGAAINPKADKTGYVPGQGHTRVAL